MKVDLQSDNLKVDLQSDNLICEQREFNPLRSVCIVHLM